MSGRNPTNPDPVSEPVPEPGPESVSGSGEFDLIGRYFAPLAGPGAFGLGDDAAVLTPAPGQQLVFTADAIIAGVHFLADDPAADVAAKLLAVNLSDLAAMGAAGAGYLITTAWPRDLNESWIADFAQGLAAAQAEHGIALLGGDTVATDGPMSLSLTAIGQLPTGTAMRRNGARVGDAIYVSGRIGDAGVGLRILRDGLVGGAAAERETAIARYRRPGPRLALGQALRGLATACIDVSDGLIADLGHLAAQSGAAMVVDLAVVPLSPLADLIGGAAAAVVAGDDYELLFTAPFGDERRLLAAAQGTGTAVSRIGRVAAGEGVEVIDAAGEKVELARPGYRHF
ncbi:MAG: thiamine-phosphate kinase [Rhodospirillaceae bacterium]|jgi:thiamine-monophosphate kinase|nr:thiamine-phosphate kinase [Rhodospirillaceae bacterium]MBT3495187.1 thiamine-phosphate kinase [Rhodospirillaceae bacterium]MBT3781053.1 thiamine-phosphate kinase [Rhodospirillaceae bacterium]MBT3977383.1 thiamine-phosphate kinase [Rhodospirillaceae bacterium]MBT4565043.1 thiamine-phosphate kinase [Rhodospirillaceae bacterium]